MRKKISAALTAVVLSAALLFAGCDGGSSARPKKKSETQKRADYSCEELQFTGPEDGQKIAIFDTSMGEIRAMLYGDLAPMAVRNFTNLCREGYYDDMSFSRVVYGFVAQAGDDSESGLSGTSIWHGNPYPIEITDKLHHYSGALCMARSGDDEEENTCLSQFYFVQSLPKMSGDLKKALEASDFRDEVKDAYQAVGGLPYLDNRYTVFGQIYEGMEVLDKIGAADTNENDRPLEDIIINSITIDYYEG